MSLFRTLSEIAAGLTTQCSQFKDAWQSYRPPLHRELNGIEGRWQGKWTSATTHHEGKLRCVLEPIVENQCKAHFRAEYGKVLRFCSSLRFELERSEDTIVLNGSIDLGELAGGIFRFQGEIRGDRFECQYESKHDDGHFLMSRETAAAV